MRQLVLPFGRIIFFFFLESFKNLLRFHYQLQSIVKRAGYGKLLLSLFSFCVMCVFVMFQKKIVKAQASESISKKDKCFFFLGL